MYCEYWNLNKPPFDNVPDPSMYVDCHTSMENVISETIFAIREANESFAVIVGAVGIGKTMSLRMIIDALDPKIYKVVLIANPSLTFPHLLREIIGQISGKPCEENRKAELLDLFKRLLISTGQEGLKVVIFIDEANALSPANLENLRLLTNMQDDQRNFFTLVLAGQLELAQRLEHPKRANLFQRISTYGRIDKLPSEEAVKIYIETRLKRAGTDVKIFTDDCIPAIWECSEQGVPRLINKICKLCLKNAETNRFHYISADMVTQIAERFQKLSKTAVQQRRLRSRPDIEPDEDDISASLMMDDSSDAEASFEINQGQTASRQENGILIQFPLVVNGETYRENIPQDVRPTQSAVPIAECGADAKLPEDTPLPDKPLPETAVESVENAVLEESADSGSLVTMSIAPGEIDTQTVPAQDESSQNIESRGIVSHEGAAVPQPEPSAPPIPPRAATVAEDSDEITIGEHRIHLNIPKDILKQVKLFNRDSANKSAGFWAAQIIKKNPQLTRSPEADPVHIWNEIRDNILKKIAV